MTGARALIAFVVVTMIACGASATTPVAGSASPSGATEGTSRPGSATSGSSTPGLGPGFREVLALSKIAEYKVSYKITDTNGLDSTAGEQSWFQKPPNSRFDFSTDVGGQRTIVSLYALVDGTSVCFTDVTKAQCFGMSGLSTALQQNTAASVHELLVQHPEQFDGVLVETRQIAGQQARCYDVRVLKAQVSGLTDGRFCYSTLGAPLLAEFKTQGGEVSMEATRFATSVLDSDFTLPAEPTTPGRP